MMPLNPSSAARLAGAGATLAAISLPAAASPEIDPAAPRPNIITILVDDMGYGDAGYMGQQWIRTPNIDQLAATGMVFTNHYAGASSCTPSRCVLMTGVHNGHATLPSNTTSDRILRRGDITVGELLQAAGYSTHFYGKWGLGGANAGPDWGGSGTLIPEALPGLPTRKGFDTSYAYLDQLTAHLYFVPYLWRGEVQEPIPGNEVSLPFADRTVYTHDLFTDDVLARINAADGSSPLYIQLSWTIPHRETKFPRSPLPADQSHPNEFNPYVPADFAGMSPQPLDVDVAYAAMITYLDIDVGRVVDAVVANPAISGNTLIIFTSDNGPQQTDGHTAAMFDSSGGLRGRKFLLDEGGIRVPFIAWWPGVVTPGTVTDHPSYFPDFLPTATDLAGVLAPQGIDGISYAPLLTGSGTQQTHDYMIWTQADRTYSAVRKRAEPTGEIWKLIRNTDGSFELYDLDSNLAENPALNLASSNPALVNELWGVIQAEDSGPLPITPGVLSLAGPDVASVPGAPGTPATYTPAPPIPGTTAFYRFDGDGGTPGGTATTVADASGPTAHDGTAVGAPTYSDDLFATVDAASNPSNTLGLSLDGVGQYVSIPDAPELDFGDIDFTIEGWVKVDNLGSRGWLVYKKGLATTDAFIDYALMCQMADFAFLPDAYGKTSGQTGNEIGLAFGNGTVSWVIVSNFEITDNEWHYVAAAFDSSGDQVRFHLDDRVETVSFVDQGRAPVNDGPLILGAHHNASGVFNQHLGATIDEIRLSRAFLAPGELLVAGYAPAAPPENRYRLDFGDIAQGTGPVQKSFRIANTGTGYAEMIGGTLAAPASPDPRLALTAGVFGPLVGGGTTAPYTVTLVPDTVGPLDGQEFVIDAQPHLLGTAAAGSPIILEVTGNVTAATGVGDWREIAH